MICPTCGKAQLTERAHLHRRTDKAPTTEPRPDRTPEEAAFLRGWDAGYALAVKREAEAATPAETGLREATGKALAQARDFVWHVQQTNLGLPKGCDGTCDLARWTEADAASALAALPKEERP